MSVVESPTEQRVEAEEVTAADLLTRAADILLEFEWQQGSAGSREIGSMCAVGAILEAGRDATGLFYSDQAKEACAINGTARDVCGIWPLATWNDEPGRTKAEVVARLREAAETSRLASTTGSGPQAAATENTVRS